MGRAEQLQQQQQQVAAEEGLRRTYSCYASALLLIWSSSSGRMNEWTVGRTNERTNERTGCDNGIISDSCLLFSSLSYYL